MPVDQNYQVNCYVIGYAMLDEDKKPLLDDKKQERRQIYTASAHEGIVPSFREGLSELAVRYTTEEAAKNTLQTLSFFHTHHRDKNLTVYPVVHSLKFS